MKIYGLVRLTKDIELKYTQNNKAIVNLSVAENQWNGNENVGHFFNCVAFGKTAEMLSNVRKGDRINIVQAELSNNNYQKDGTMVYKDQITIFKFDFIEKKEQGSYKESLQQNDRREDTPSIDIDYSELPF